MAYIGQDIEGGVLEKQTLPANGVLTSFDLDYFSDANGLIVSVQGVVQEPGVAYTVSGKKINYQKTVIFYRKLKLYVKYSKY